MPLTIIDFGQHAECAQEHFSQTSVCPSCRHSLGADDFLQLTVADSTGNQNQEGVAGLFQRVLTKGTHSAGFKNLKCEDLCQTLTNAQNDIIRVQRFVYKQIMKVRAQSSQNTERLQHDFDRLRLDFKQLKQSADTARIEAEKKEKALIASSASVKEQLRSEQERVRDLLQQVDNFRRHHSSPRMGSSSSQAGNSTGSGHRQSSRPQPPPFAHQGVVQQRPDPTPIRPSHSFESTRSLSSAPPPFRDMRGHHRDYSFSRGGARSLTSNAGPLRQMQSSSYSRASGYNRRSGGGGGGGNGGFLGGRR